MNDIRYSEFLFLSALASEKIVSFNSNDGGVQMKSVNANNPMFYSEMAAALIEDLYVKFRDDYMQSLVTRLRGELYAANQLPPPGLHPHQWADPRKTVLEVLRGASLQGICITYRGLRRIEELRDLLKQDRILEDFGVLLSVRYFRRDIQDALQRDISTSVSVLCADMDNFGVINKKYSHAAGDVVMKSYLEIVRDTIGVLGTSYRGVGDETRVLIIGQGHDRAVELAESIRKNIETMQCRYNEVPLPKVTTSIGVSTTPPETRTADIENSAEDRKRQAKEKGKNIVVSS